MTDITYCLAPRYIISRKLIRYRHIETVSFLSLCVWFYDHIGSPYIIMRWIVPDSTYYTQKVHITFILGMRSVGTYPTYSCSLMLSTKQYTDTQCTLVCCRWINCWTAENDCRFVLNKYEFLSIYRQTNGRYIDMTTHPDMPPLAFIKKNPIRSHYRNVNFVLISI